MGTRSIILEILLNLQGCLLKVSCTLKDVLDNICIVRALMHLHKIHNNNMCFFIDVYGF
jgi:hypothetical protein